jgi:hypothetical protein
VDGPQRGSVPASRRISRGGVSAEDNFGIGGYAHHGTERPGARSRLIPSARLRAHLVKAVERGMRRTLEHAEARR